MRIKKILFLVSILIAVLFIGVSPSLVLAADPPTNMQGVPDVFGKIQTPPQIQKIGFGAGGINQIIKVVVNLMFLVGGILVLVYFVWGAIEWMTSGGNKEGTAGARKRISYAIVGLILLGLSFVILRLLGYILGLGDIFNFV